MEYDSDHFINPHTLDFFETLDSNGDGHLSKLEFFSLDKRVYLLHWVLQLFQLVCYLASSDTKLEFLVDVVAIETALGVDIDLDGISSYFDTIDSNGDGNIQLGEFYAIPNAKTDRFVCGGFCIAGGVAAASAVWGYFG